MRVRTAQSAAFHRFLGATFYNTNMYEDRESIKVFERLHVRDRLAQLARHAGDVDDPDVFATHARAEARDGMLSIVLSIAAVATLIGAAILLWQ